MHLSEYSPPFFSFSFFSSFNPPLANGYYPVKYIKFVFPYSSTDSRPWNPHLSILPCLEKHYKKKRINSRFLNMVNQHQAIGPHRLLSPTTNRCHLLLSSPRIGDFATKKARIHTDSGLSKFLWCENGIKKGTPFIASHTRSATTHIHDATNSAQRRVVREYGKFENVAVLCGSHLWRRFRKYRNRRVCL